MHTRFAISHWLYKITLLCPILILLVSCAPTLQAQKQPAAQPQIVQAKEIKKSKKTPKAKPTKKKRDRQTLITLSQEDFQRARKIVSPTNLKQVGVDDEDRTLIRALTRKSYADKLQQFGIALKKRTTAVPYKYRIDGFIKRVDKPAPRNAGGGIVVNDGYHDSFMVEKLLRAFAGDYPHIASLHIVGKSWQGKDMLALKISDNPNKEENEPAFLFVGAHHGSELISTEFVLDILEHLIVNYEKDAKVRSWIDNYEIWCLPLANPDGCHAFLHTNGAGRKNGRDTNNNNKVDPSDGVDLNRNYPYRWHSLGEKGSSSKLRHHWYRGPKPGSEPETQAIMSLAAEQRFVMLVSFHTSGTKVLVPYTIDNAQNPQPSVAWQVGREIASLCVSNRDDDRKYKAVRNLYSVDGTDQDWHYWKYGTLAYLLEGPYTNPKYNDYRDKLVEGIRPGWGYMLDRLASGPTLSGCVIDSKSGTPLEAAITLDEIKTFEKEVHTSHPQTGRFDRILPGEGTFHLNFAKEGYITRTIAVQVGAEWKTITVKMQEKRVLSGE
jgi:Zinc carboxypeptidase